MTDILIKWANFKQLSESKIDDVFNFDFLSLNAKMADKFLTT